jgi:indole-3-glycerol phosphate synthase
MRQVKGFLAEVCSRSTERVELLEKPPTRRSLRGAVENAIRERGRAALILEYKRCSPRGFTAYQTPWEFLEVTLPAADAYSVLVEPYWFCGSLELIPWFARYRPVLAKDFTVSPVQLRAYQHGGAAAALLVLDVVGWKKLEELYREARALGLEALIETSNARDAVNVMHSYPEALVGINARSLETLEVSFKRLLEEVAWAAHRKPSGALLVAESGIDSTDKAVQLARAGADALLIGTWTMRDPLSVRGLPEALERES